jgi:LmbE family N-acetylglucosaminyl deacetylase
LRFLKSFALILLLGLLHVSPAAAQFPPAPGTGPGLPETIEAIDSARVTTRILYITAHPDDESAAVLTYLARGLHADVALLSITRGEGGQNALGPEQAPQLGLIRTQELLAATRGYGVKLYFTRARDFGYSKTPEETEKIWGDQVLRDMVEIIRTLRPNVVINGWGGVHSGHGHHQTSGLWTPKAVALAADKSYQVYPGCADCPEDYTWGSPSSPVLILDIDRGSDNPSGYVLPLDDVSPLWGKTWRELGMDAFVNHRTQGISGFINSPFLRRPIALKREDGQPLDPAVLSQPLPELSRFPAANRCGTPDGFATALTDSDRELAIARSAALELRWADASTAVTHAAMAMHRLTPRGVNPKECEGSDPFALLSEVLDVQQRIDRALMLAAGIKVDATADRSEITVGDTFQVTVFSRCRPETQCKLSEPQVELSAQSEELERKTSSAGTVFSIRLTSEFGMRRGWDIGLPNGIPFASVTQPVEVAGYQFKVDATIEHIAATSITLDRVPLRLVPEFTVLAEPKQLVLPLPNKPEPIDVFLKIHSYTSRPQALKVVTLDVPADWLTSPPASVQFDGVGDKYVHLSVTPPNSLAPGDYLIKAYAKREPPALKVTPPDSFSTSLVPLPSMPSILWSEPAQCIVHAFDINVPPNLRVGYISAEGEPIPEALKRLGINVEMLDATALNFGDLSKYDAIVVGVRAYELRPELPGANKRLLDYVSNGGTLVVQYNRDFVWDKLQPAPYPAKIGSPTPRTTDETAEVRFLQPNDPLLNSPNKITVADFNNWVQERGLYYWSNFDSRYTPLLAMHDPGETDLNGSLVYTRYGQGTYIYTGLSFFRQLPEGNSGAYRLFVNLISASRTGKPGATH